MTTEEGLSPQEAEVSGLSWIDLEDLALHGDRLGRAAARALEVVGSIR